MENPHYAYSPIVRRTPLRFPGGQRLAVWIGMNVEHYSFGVPAISLAPFTASLVPDPLNHGWRDYGPRVGVWRLMEILDGFDMRASGILNSEVCLRYPEIVGEGSSRGWCWVSHGANNSTWQNGMKRDEERDYLTKVTDDIQAGTGCRPKGWLGPALTASANTYALLAELGYQYTLDWAIDDEPVRLSDTSGKLLSVPYSAELNDLPLFAIRGQTATEFSEAVIDQFDQLLEEGESRPRVMGLGLHPFLTGQPFRARHLSRALEHMRGHDDVWFATSDEIASWYLELELGNSQQSAELPTR